MTTLQRRLSASAATRRASMACRSAVSDDSRAHSATRRAPVAVSRFRVSPDRTCRRLRRSHGRAKHLRRSTTAPTRTEAKLGVRRPSSEAQQLAGQLGEGCGVERAGAGGHHLVCRFFSDYNPRHRQPDVLALDCNPPAGPCPPAGGLFPFLFVEAPKMVPRPGAVVCLRRRPRQRAWRACPSTRPSAACRAWRRGSAQACATFGPLLLPNLARLDVGLPLATPLGSGFMARPEISRPTRISRGCSPRCFMIKYIALLMRCASQNCLMVIAKGGGGGGGSMYSNCFAALALAPGLRPVTSGFVMSISRKNPTQFAFADRKMRIENQIGNSPRFCLSH